MYKLEMFVLDCSFISTVLVNSVCPPSLGLPDGCEYLKRTSSVFTLERNLDEACQFNSLSEGLLYVCGTHAQPGF